MDKDKSAVSKFLEGVEDNKFETVIDSPFSEPEAEVVEEKIEKPIPYNRDEKLQKYISKEVEKRLKDFTPEPTKVEEKEVDDYYVRLIGNDTPEKVAMIREAQARDERMLEQAEERAFNRLSRHEQEAIAEEREAEDELGNALESIEENFDVNLTSNQKLRSEFLTFVERIAPKDKDGDITEFPDMNSAWETFNERRAPQNSRAKQLASQGLSRSSETTSTPQRRPTFDMDVEEMIAGTK